MAEQQSQHWVDILVDGILTWQKKHGITKLHVDDMKTPSGRVHVGALRGVILHDLVAKVLAEKTAQPITSTYVFNDLDNMDSLPGYLPETYAEHMGRSLYKIPAPPLDHSGIDFSGLSEEKKAPYQTATTMGEFYALDFIEAFRILGCSQEIVWSHDLYQSGKMDQVIREALDNVEKLKQIYKTVADYQLPEEWFPFQVTCEQCGLTGSTLVTGWDEEQVSYSCQENKVEWAHGCGHSGKISPFGGNGKLLWKVDWPGHWKALGITIEGAGKDHTSAGGSRDMANAICSQVFQIPAPFDIPYEWILIRGTKMSSSKGIGTSAREFVGLFPAEVGRFLFVNKHYNQVIDFDPATMAIPDLFDEYDQSARIYWGEEEGDTRLGRSFELSQLGTVSEAHFLPRFRDVALWMQYPDLDLETEFEKVKGSSLTEQEKLELNSRLEYAKLWVKRYAPNEYQLSPTKELPEAAKTLSANQIKFLEEVASYVAKNPDVRPEDLQQWIFESAKTSLGSKLGFQAIYLAYLGKKAGPKAAWFLLSIDAELRTKRIAELKQLHSNIQEKSGLNRQTVDSYQPLQISQSVKEKFPSLSVGYATLKNISIKKMSLELEKAKQKLVENIGIISNDTISQIPAVQSYRQLYKETGIDWHSRRPSPEALLRRLSQGKDLYTINTCVDAANLAVLEDHVSVGVFNLAKLEQPLKIDLATGNEQILLLGDQTETDIKPGEVCYFDQLGPYNLDFNYRDSQRTMVTEETTDLLINVDGVYSISPEQVANTLQKVVSYIQAYCGGELLGSQVITTQ